MFILQGTLFHYFCSTNKKGPSYNNNVSGSERGESQTPSLCILESKPFLSLVAVVFCGGGEAIADSLNLLFPPPPLPNYELLLLLLFSSACARVRPTILPPPPLPLPTVQGRRKRRGKCVKSFSPPTFPPLLLLPIRSGEWRPKIRPTTKRRN